MLNCLFYRQIQCFLRLIKIAAKSITALECLPNTQTNKLPYVPEMLLYHLTAMCDIIIPIILFSFFYKKNTSLRDGS